jgi:phosphoribosylaminoimidazolecarboxamide formyltransferase/IMP cyclohydrolase
MPRALLSVSDKTHLEPFARALVMAGYDLVSTGGTYRTLHDAGIPVTKVSDVTGFPEILGGRVKTLHPKIHGGILAKRDDASLDELEQHAITPIDLVVVNLYPFREAVAQKEVTLQHALENIDIGGPTMIRAAAKNFPAVAVVVDPRDYDGVLERLQGAGLDEGFRQTLAVKAFAHTAAYDAAIVRHLGGGELPDEGALEVRKVSSLRYGENPHQRASLWRLGNERGPVLDAEILHGKEMSFNNYQDAEAAWNLVTELPKAAAVAVKHANPCGVGTAPDLLEAYKKAHAADPVSIFGGIVALNGTVNEALAEELNRTFLEIVIAPAFNEAALSILRKKKNLRLLRVTEGSSRGRFDIRRIRGGLLLQDMDEGTLDEVDLKVVTKREPTEREWVDLRFAWTVCKHVKSNAIVLAKDGVTTGIGGGQVSRLWAMEGAVGRAGESAAGSALASDAFFPFDDALRLAAQAGVRSVIQPGGSVRDAEVIQAADELGIAMVFTGMRHFRH